MSELLRYYVSTKGSDGFSGLVEKPNAMGTDGPLKTVQAAIQKLTALRREGKFTKGAVEILVEPGIYSSPEPLVLGLESLGNPDLAIEIRKNGEGEARFVGGYNLTGAVPAGEKGIYKIDLTAQSYPAMQVKDLYCNGQRLRKARYPKYDAKNPYGAGWLFVPGKQVNIYQKGFGDPLQFKCSDPRPSTWSHMDEVELFVFPRFNWNSDIVPVKSYDAQTQTVTLARPCSQAIYPTDRFYFQNVREELTDPGEWYFDREHQVVYFIPPEDVDPATMTLTIPAADYVIKVEGEPLPANFSDGTYDQLDATSHAMVSMDWNSEPIGYVTFRNLTIECCNRAAFFNWHAHHIQVIGCTIRNTGEHGVMSLRGKHNRIAGCDIYDTGSMGVYMSGGFRDPHQGFYRDCYSEIDNNYIHHVGRIRRGTCVIDILGVGIRVSHNLIHDCSRTGIHARGNRNVIEYNHIRHVNIETSDAAAINMCDRELSNHDSKIRYNKIHDVLGLHLSEGKWEPRHFTFGIYLDDFTSGVDIYGNLIYRTPRGGIFIHGNQDVRVFNNVVLDADKDMLFLRRWGRGLEFERLGTHGMSMTRNTYKHNIVASHNPNCAVYAVENCMNEDWEIDMKDNEFNENLIYNYNGPLRLWVCQDLGYDVYDRWFEDFSVWQAKGHDTDSIFADPMFVDPEHDDYRLKDNSPAYQFGFEPLPIDQMGPYESPERATWPIVEASGARETPVVIDYFHEPEE